MYIFTQQLRTIYRHSLFAVIMFASAIPVCVAQPIAARQAKPQIKVDSIVVVVNSDVITRKELDERVSLIAERLKKQDIHPPRAELERQVLERMIVESVQLQMAKERGIRVDDRQLDATVAMIAEQNHLTIEKFQKGLEEAGSSLAAFRESIKNEIIRQRLREYEVISKIEISDSEIDHFLNIQQSDVASSQSTQEVRLAHILIRIPENASPEQIAGRRDRAEHVLQNLRAGGSFQQNAATYSDGDEGLNGGDMGWRNAARLPALFIEAIAKLKTGETTDILKSANGFHILKVLDRRETQQPVATAPAHSPKPLPIGGAVQQIHARHILIKVNQLVSADEARHKLVELKERLVNKAATFEELARMYSNDTSASKGGDLGWIYPGDTVPEFEKTLMTLQPGEISDPVETQFGFHLIQVIERKTEDASMERKRVAAKQALRERKIEEATEEWMRQLRDRAYVEYRFEEE